MRKVALGAAVFVVVATVSFARGHDAKTFRGQIMDSRCASTGGHNPAGYLATYPTPARECTLACVKAGSAFVLYNAVHNSALQLDNQAEARGFAGENVTVTGTYNRATKTIHVETIEAAP